jgi:hypothetical protein
VSSESTPVTRDDLLRQFDAADEAGDLDLMEEIVAKLEALVEANDSTEESETTETESSDDGASEEPTPEQDEDETEETEEEPEGESEVAETDKAKAESEPKAEEPVAESKTEPTQETTAEASTEPETSSDVPVVQSEDVGASDTSKEPVAMAASGTDIQVPEEHAPVVTASAAVVTAGTDIPGFSAGQQLSGELEVAQAFTSRLNTLRRVTGGDGDQHIVASIRVEYPEDRVLSETDVEQNMAVIQRVTSNEAIVAAGGWCAPLPTIYDFAGDIGSTARPIRDALPKFQATRGGVQYVRPPQLTEVRGAMGYMNGSDGAVGSIWNDVKLTLTGGDVSGDGTAGAKPCLTFNCPTPEEAIADAITMCLKFGNLSSRAYPELVARHNRLALVEQARLAEDVLLAKMHLFATANANNVVTATKTWGTARDILLTLSKAAVAFRFRHRLSENYPLNFVAPLWLKDVIREDLFVGLPGDALSVADAAIARLFADRNIRPVWHYDGAVSGADASLVTDAFADNGKSTATLGGNDGFPANVTGYLFAEGSMVFLDSGTLDLGIVRDSTLNGTNDYQVFAETFEGLANVGYRPLEISAEVAVAGAVTGTLDPATVLA